MTFQWDIWNTRLCTCGRKVTKHYKRTLSIFKTSEQRSPPFSFRSWISGTPLLLFPFVRSWTSGTLLVFPSVQWLANFLLFKYFFVVPGSNILKSPRARRVRTTSMSQSNKKTTAESILHADRRTIYTAGRPPWYNCTGGHETEPFLIGEKVMFIYLFNS